MKKIFSIGEVAEVLDVCRAWCATVVAPPQSDGVSLGFRWQLGYKALCGCDVNATRNLKYLAASSAVTARGKRRPGAEPKDLHETRLMKQDANHKADLDKADLDNVSFCFA